MIALRPSRAGRVLARIGCSDTVASVEGDGGIWLDAEVRINRTDIGLTWNPMGMAGVNNTLTIHAVFTRR